MTKRFSALKAAFSRAAQAKRAGQPDAQPIRGRAPSGRRLKVVVFAVGAASLGTEIAAARLLAPYFGASTIVWANTIATVLLALSAGYWLGGRWADRDPSFKALCRIVAIAGLLLAAIPFIAGEFLRSAVKALEAISAGGAVGSLVAVLVLVAGPVMLLGAVSPYAIRLAVGSVEESGSTSGRLYALSTAGSLVGTFAAALVLVPFVGTQRTFLVFALVLASVALLGLPRRAFLIPAAIAGLIALPAGIVRGETVSGRTVYETETPYQYARVTEAGDGTRRLELNEGLAVHSVYRPGRYLTNDYWDDFLVAPAAASGRVPRRLAILGNAGGTTARAYGHFFPDTEIDAVELDGRLTPIARRYFDLEAPRLRVITADARLFLRESRRRYDAIFVDAYRQPYVPFHLATREFFELALSRLEQGGSIAINVGHPEGSNVLESALTATMRSVFGEVWRDPVRPTNTLLIAVRGSRSRPWSVGRDLVPGTLGALALEFSGRVAPGLGAGTVFTDDRAPVEWLIDRSIVQYVSRTE